MEGGLKYNSIDIEGPDQVGKGDAVNNIACELSKNGIETTVISFPYYATPIGNIIKCVLKEGIPEEVEMEKDSEVEVKMALFALNRLEILNCIEAQPKSDICLFDRRPFSNALTISYSLRSGLKEEDLDGLVAKAMCFDSHFRNVLNIDNCVIHLQTKNTEWVQSRKEGDLYERKDVQELSEYIYSKFEEYVGEGWGNITTRDSNEWKPREEIRENCINFAKSRIKILNKGGLNVSKAPNYLSIDTIQHTLYFESHLSEKLKEEWVDALKKNDKIGVYNGAKKISEALVGTTQRIKWYNDITKVQVSKLLTEIPDLTYLIEYYCGESFLIKFLDSVNE